MTEKSKPGILSNAGRLISSWILDKPAYFLLTLAYQLFFSVSKVKLFSEGDLILKFYGRVQLILGVFMMFHLVMIIINGIIDPDTFFSGKKGASSFIMRICVSLILLTTLLPINIPNPQNNYEKSIKGNGLLFGILYSLQDRLLMNNTIGRLIIGTDYSSVYSYDGDDELSEYEQIKAGANEFAIKILKTFYLPNLVPEDVRVHEEGKRDVDIPENYMCGENEFIDSVYNEENDPLDIISVVNETCKSDGLLAKAGRGIVNFFGGDLEDPEVYVFSYIPVIPGIVGFIFVFIILSFSVEVAVRAIKLAILRLIAPIPIISYMDPKGSGDEAFNSWVKTLISTYVDLFIRLATIYFVFFLITNIANGNITISNTGNTLLDLFTFVLICIGLFVFAREAPKFIKKAVGMKDDGNFSLFGGLKSIVGVGAVVGGSIGTAAAYRKAKKEENEALHPGQTVRNFARNRVAGISGALTGLTTGGKAFIKDGNATSVAQAQGQAADLRASHSTSFGRRHERLHQMFYGESLADKGAKRLEKTGKAAELISKLKSNIEEAALAYGAYGEATDSTGVRHSFQYNDFLRQFQSADKDGNFSYNGTKYNTSAFSTAFFDELKESQINNWMNRGATISGGKTFSSIKTKYSSLIKDIDAAVDGSAPGTIAFDVNNYDTYGASIGAANNYVSDVNAKKNGEGMRQTMHNANKINKNK